jgi:hypothetical protein
VDNVIPGRKLPVDRKTTPITIKNMKSILPGGQAQPSNYNSKSNLLGIHTIMTNLLDLQTYLAQTINIADTELEFFRPVPRC